MSLPYNRVAALLAHAPPVETVTVYSVVQGDEVLERHLREFLAVVFRDTWNECGEGLPDFVPARIVTQTAALLPGEAVNHV